MNEYVLVEFLAKGEDRLILIDKLQQLGKNLLDGSLEYEYEDYDHSSIEEWYRVSGRIKSEYASIIKLQDPFLAERMRISYIPDSLKNQYRKK